MKKLEQLQIEHQHKTGSYFWGRVSQYLGDGCYEIFFPHNGKKGIVHSNRTIPYNELIDCKIMDVTITTVKIIGVKF